MNNYGTKIVIHLVDGLSRGIREVKIDQWSGKAICGPRNRLQDLGEKYPELKEGACVYFLLGDAETGELRKAYVGQTDAFLRRMKEHDSKKDWWQEVVVFVGYNDSLTKTGIEYLEGVCVTRLRAIGKSTLENNVTPRIKKIPNEDIGGLEVFYGNIALIMPLLGYEIFVQGDISQKGVEDKELPEFVCKKIDGRIAARGILLKDGKMKVLKNSNAEIKEVASFKTHAYWKLKQALLKMGRLKKKGGQLVFTDDYIFDSSSAAAAIIKARPAAGPLEWRAVDNGKTLRDVLNKRIQ